MTALEDRFRETLHDMADEVVAVPLLQRLENSPQVHPSRRRLVAVVAAAAAAATVVATSYVALRPDEPSIIEPVVRPPKVFRLSDVTTTRPGPSRLVVVLARNDTDGFVHQKPAYVLPVAGDAAVLVKESDVLPVWTQHLSGDGTRLVRLEYADDNTIEVLNLVTGKRGDHRGICPQLSPDNATISAWSGFQLRLIDVRSGTERAVRRVSDDTESCVGHGWSPDGRLLAIVDGQQGLVVDRRGQVRHQLPDRIAVNNSMSWSPDGRSILLYARAEGHFVVHQLDSGSETVLVPPGDALRPLGWAGSRIVWLAGEPGDQRLVTTDQHGAGPQPWMRLDVGRYPVESVSWSRALGGTAAD